MSEIKCQCNKTAYATEAFALADLKRIQEKTTREKKPVGVYQCKGGKWHLTSQPNWNVVIAELKDELKAAQGKIQELTVENFQLKSSDNKRISMDSRIKTMNHTILKHKKLIKKLRRSNSELISENINLKRKNESNKSH